jgi:hypothetical protein
MKNNKFSFYEVVKIVVPKDDYKVPVFSEGVILGMADDDTGDWYYQVHFENPIISLGFKENEIEKTGLFMKRSDFYDGTTVSVEVDKNGVGSFKQDHTMQQ